MMAKTIAGALLSLHAQTPLHAGAGTALGVVDLPISRERSTQWPTIPGSALKGILRDTCREKIAALTNLDDERRWDDKDDSPEEHQKRRQNQSKRERADATLKLNHLFGPPTEGAGEFAGAISVTDARLLAFPVRSLTGVFAWVTCPAVLQRLKQDARLADISSQADIDWQADIPQVVKRQFVAPQGSAKSACVLASGYAVLEEFDFEPIDGDSKAGESLTSVIAWIAKHVLPTPDLASWLETNFLLISDDMFTHFVRFATEVTARIGLNYETKTVRDGALFYQEFLPAESLLYSIVLANPSRSLGKNQQSAAALLDDLSQYVSQANYLQIGGDETTGKGWCAVRLDTHANQESASEISGNTVRGHE